ncbi:SGNH/GDSL hydrolase family protein [candidate division CSSED10-310 bacterium]|uniref:SGNH/GDSL hydrolase family protein n=1 Tax=candidate division CSSED10-310 bacterium TaxID=2855610 RepID=A0ABV6Z1A5_UNCC1
MNRTIPSSLILVLIVLLTLGLSFFSCSDDDDDGEGTPTPTSSPTLTPTPTVTFTPTSTPIPVLNDPIIISPAPGIKTSAHYPLFIIQDTNMEFSGVTYSFVWSTAPDMSEIIIYEVCDPAQDGFIRYYPSLELIPETTYYYRCECTAAGYYTSGTAVCSITIEYIGSNTPNIYLCAGDSITQGKGEYGTDYPYYLTLLLQDYFSDSAQAINEGIGGITSGALDLLFWDFLNEHDPAYTIILIGLNDIEWPQFCLEPYNCQTFAHIKNMASKCRQNDTIPILCTLTPNLFAPTSIRLEMESLNSQIKAYCNSHGIDCVDFYTAFFNYEGHITDLFMADGDHPNELGNQFMAQTVLNYLSSRTIN